MVNLSGFVCYKVKEIACHLKAYKDECWLSDTCICAHVISVACVCTAAAGVSFNMHSCV